MIFRNDEPTLEDQLGREALVCTIAKGIVECTPPHVFGVHGDWGAGKTSFLHQLHHELTGECPQNPRGKPLVKGRKRQSTEGRYEDHVTVIWFEAWRYQYESVPIVALLQEIRTQLPWCAKALQEAKKLADVTTRSALLSFESVTKKIGIQPSKVIETGEKWEQEHLAAALPSHVVRQQLEHALRQLLGQTSKGRDRRLVVLVDDLDRCEPEAGYKLLEGIKIYLNLPNCVFVLGMNQNVIESAVAKHLAKTGDEALHAQRAREYLEKLCQVMIQLPIVRNPAQLLGEWLHDLAENDAIRGVVSMYRCLPANPRKIKAFANVVERFAEHARTSVPAKERQATQHAQLLVTMACLYQFHPQLYRRLEGDPRFWGQLYNWATGRPTGIGVLQTLRGTLASRVTEKKEAEPPGPPELFETHPDPGAGDVVWIQPLIEALGELRETVIRRYLLV